MQVLDPEFLSSVALGRQAPAVTSFTRERAEDHLTVEFRGDIYFLEPVGVHKSYGTRGGSI